MPFLPAIAAIASTAAAVKSMQDSDSAKRDAAERAQRQDASANLSVQGQQQKQQAMIDAMKAASPDIFGQQQNYANQLQQQANGQGPNPAQAMLNQNTGANVANQAALMAGQRGAGANAGLMARQAAQQGANIQQNAIGQGATLQAQQQLSAMGLLGNQVNNMAGQQIQAQQAMGQQGLGQQANINQANANTGNLSLGYANQENQRGMQGVQIGSQLLGGLLGDAGAATMPSGKAHGGMIGYAVGGPVSNVGRAMMNMQSGGNVPGQAQVAGDSQRNDTVPAMLSPGEVVIPRSVMQGKNPAQDAAKFVQAILAKKGMR